jgi:hypothetical protein
MTFRARKKDSWLKPGQRLKLRRWRLRRRVLQRATRLRSLRRLPIKPSPPKKPLRMHPRRHQLLKKLKLP